MRDVVELRPSPDTYARTVRVNLLVVGGLLAVSVYGAVTRPGAPTGVPWRMSTG